MQFQVIGTRAALTEKAQSEKANQSIADIIGPPDRVSITDPRGTSAGAPPTTVASAIRQLQQQKMPNAEQIQAAGGGILGVIRATRSLNLGRGSIGSDQT